MVNSTDPEQFEARVYPGSAGQGLIKHCDETKKRAQWRSEVNTLENHKQDYYGPEKKKKKKKKKNLSTENDSQAQT